MNCLVLDHHKLYNDLNSEKTVHIKPQMINPVVDGSKYCASKMCYDYFSRHSNLSDLDWIAVVGVIGDFNQEPWHKFVDQVYRKYNVDCTGDIMKSKFGQAAIVIGSAEAVVPGKTAEAIKLLYSARSVEDVLSSNLAELAQEIQKEVNSIVNNFEEFAEVRGDIIFLELNSKYKIKSDVSNAISRLHPDMTIFVYTKPNKYGMVNVSGRRQDGKVDVAEVIEKSVVGLADAKGGGHKPAAAASVRKHDFAEFKKRILEILIK
jgi:oligoribonuclease NrnB/cAMP/cGMP phosphodiesterase (DHH superfamily)